MVIEVLLVGGPLDGEVYRVSEEHTVLYLADNTRRWWRRRPVRIGHYRPNSAADYLSAVWKWQGWSTLL